jgi:hypothetical protein
LMKRFSLLMWSKMEPPSEARCERAHKLVPDQKSLKIQTFSSTDIGAAAL